MFLLKIVPSFKSSVLHKCVLLNVNNLIFNKYSAFTNVQNGLMPHLFGSERRWSSNSSLRNRTDDLVADKHTTASLFPEPRVTLNIFASKLPEKPFEISYKQSSPSPKSGKKKARKTAVANDWICTYSFVKPEREKFVCSALSKKQAAEKAAAEALTWLYSNKHINENGEPVHKSEAISKLNDPLHARLPENILLKIEGIWEEYQASIKDVYEETHQNALRLEAASAILDVPESSADQDDQYSDSELDEDVPFDGPEPGKAVHPVYGRICYPPSDAVLRRRDMVLRDVLDRSLEELTPLPIDGYTDTICSALEDARVVVIEGAAGCGKSTRAPQAILRRFGVNARVLVAQPRRVAAIGLARRVASELNEEVGNTVGYQVRLESNPPSPPGGSILYCTSGILLRRLQQNPGLIGCSHVVIDEAHERDINTDMALLLLKRALNLNPELKVVVMSATLNTEVFTRYFDSCPVLAVPGRTFPIDVVYLDDFKKSFRSVNVSKTLAMCSGDSEKPFLDYNEIVNVIKAVDANVPEGAILVFLPGWADIKAVKTLLERELRHSNLHMILPVHSRLSMGEQSRMFDKPMVGVRKVVLATNIAETSITIPDVVYVVDTGAHKETRTADNTGNSSLECGWISLAAAKQRAGRAGRVQPGRCYKLYTRKKEETFVPHNTPEILRVPLDNTVLMCKSFAPGEKVEGLLSQLPEPPGEVAVQYAIKELVDLGALSPSNQNLTRLGGILSSFPVHPRLGCMLVYSLVMGNVIAVANIVAQLSARTEVFVNAADRRDDIREVKRSFDRRSDHVALHRIQLEFERVLTESGTADMYKFCDEYGLRADRLLYCKAISTLYLKQLLKCNMVTDDDDVEDLNRYSEEASLSKCAVLCGCNKVLLTKRSYKSRGKSSISRNVYTSTREQAQIGSDSVNYDLKKSGSTKRDILTYYGGFHSVDRRALVLHSTSMISLEALLICSRGNVIKQLSETNAEEAVLFLPSHKLSVSISSRHADAILQVRTMFWGTLQYYIERNTRSGEEDRYEEVNRFRRRLMQTLCELLIEAEGGVVDDDKHR